MSAPEPTGPACPECGARSVSRGWGATTDMIVQEFYDDDGRFHRHDPNYSSTEFTCRKCQHSWGTSSRPTCWVRRNRIWIGVSMAMRVGVYTGHPTEQRPDSLIVDLGLDPSDEDVLSAIRAAPPASWLCYMAPDGGTVTFHPLAEMDLTRADWITIPGR